MGVYHYCSTIYFGSIGQQTREIGTNVTFLGITQCSYLSKWVIFGGKSMLVVVWFVIIPSVVMQPADEEYWRGCGALEDYASPAVVANATTDDVC